MTNEKREALEILLAEHASEVIEAVIDGIAAAGSTPEWDSETIEYVMSPLQRLFEELDVPNPGSSGDEDANTKYWAEVGGYDYEGEFQDEEPEPTTYEIESKFVHLTDATVTRGKYHGGGLAVVAEAEVDGFMERETLSVNLSAYGLEPEENQFYVKDYAQHEGLASALVVAGIATFVSLTPVTFGPHDTQAWLMQISEEIQ